jgi:ACS family glucarate transporter-like MFS transporter
MEIVDLTVETRIAAKRTAARWLCIAPTLVLLVVVNQLDKTDIAVIAADRSFLSEMALTHLPERIGFLSTIFFFGYGIGLLAWGFIVDWVGPRRSAIIGVLGWALTTIWCASAKEVTALYLARFVLGLAEGCIWPVCNSYSARWFPVRERGRIQSVWVNGNQVGVALGLPMVTWLISVSGWRVVFWVLGASSLLLEPLLLFLVPDRPECSPFTNEEERQYIASQRAHSDTEHSSEIGQLRVLLRSSGFWIVTLCHVGTVATLFGLVAWIPTYLTQARGLPFDSLKGWVAAAYVLPIVVALAAGHLADRSLRPGMIGALSSAAVATMILAAVMLRSTSASVILLVTALAAPMIFGAINASIIQGLAPPLQIGRATGLFVGVGNLVGGLTPTIIGALISVFGGRYLVAFAFISGVNCVLIALYLLIDRRLPRRAEAFAG